MALHERMAKACKNESHPLYGTFMPRLSDAIFERDEEDVNLLREAKRCHLVLAGIKKPSLDAVNKSISKNELAKHCKRQTRGSVETVRLIDHLIISLQHATDTLGVPLLREEVFEIWKEEKRHVACIQDPKNVNPYTKTGKLSKGIKLPVFSCARGNTSLESFRSHLKNFIPGKILHCIHVDCFF